MQSPRHLREVVGQRAEDLLGEEDVDVIVGSLLAGAGNEPIRRPVEFAGERADLFAGGRVFGAASLVGLEGAGETLARLAEPGGQFGGQARAPRQRAHVTGLGRNRRVVEQQHDA